MSVPNVKTTMPGPDQHERLTGRIYKEFDFPRPLGLLAMMKEIIAMTFNRTLPRTKVLFVQWDEKWDAVTPQAVEQEERVR